MTFRLLHRPGRPLIGVAALATVLVATACGGSSAAPADRAATTDKPGATVSTTLLAFDPKDVHITKGQTVTWVGGDNITHVLVEGTYKVGADSLRTSESDDGVFKLDLAKKGQKVSHTYDKAGTFTYFCTIHKGMNGTVTVS